MKTTIILFSILVFASLTFGQSVVIKNSADNTIMVVEDDGDVGIGTITPQGKLDLISTTGALIVPRMTTTERAGLPIVSGSIIYNTDDEQFNFLESGVWVGD